MECKRHTNEKLPTGSVIGNDYSKAEAIVCRIAFIYCDGTVTNCEVMLITVK